MYGILYWISLCIMLILPLFMSMARTSAPMSTRCATVHTSCSRSTKDCQGRRDNSFALLHDMWM